MTKPAQAPIATEMPHNFISKETSQYTHATAQKWVKNGDTVSSVIEAHRTILQRVRPLWTLSLLSGFGWLDCVYSGEAEFQRWSGKVNC
jgi:hypothetical protein